MESAPEADRLVTAGRAAREPERDFHGIVAARREQAFRQTWGSDLDKRSRQPHGGSIGVAARSEGQLIELRLHRCNDTLTSMADMVNIVAMEIEQAVSA